MQILPDKEIWGYRRNFTIRKLSIFLFRLSRAVEAKIAFDDLTSDR